MWAPVTAHFLSQYHSGNAGFRVALKIPKIDFCWSRNKVAQGEIGAIGM